MRALDIVCDLVCVHYFVRDCIHYYIVYDVNEWANLVILFLGNFSLIFPYLNYEVFC